MTARVSDAQTQGRQNAQWKCLKQLLFVELSTLYRKAKLEHYMWVA